MFLPVSTGRLDGKGITEMKQYAVIYKQGPTNWSAYVPDLPGCVAAGDTREETEQLMKEAIEIHLEAMREDGEPIPEPTTQAAMLEVAA